ncbi:MAG: RNA polymerase factor sigma-54 [Sterolibacterium sp.]|nr:RNA polymerase factor sigma-54 [Sterolibacterium sp.]MBP9798970.1 RNA polymerase factor sigma-54 [Sterolibacterium sp.]
MKQTLQLKTTQHLALTPQLQQAIRLLQLSTLELNQEVEQALQSNPMLEQIEPAETVLPHLATGFDAPATTQEATPDTSAGGHDENSATFDESDLSIEHEWGSEARHNTSRSDGEQDDTDFTEYQKAEISLHEHLQGQLGLMQLMDHEREGVRFLLDALDEDGYLAQPLDDLLDVLLTDEATDEERETVRDELAIALRRLQSLDPPGVGARSPQECLTLQLQTHPASATRTLALKLVGEHLELLAARDFARLKKALKCNDEALRDAHALICSLNPRPGAQYAPIDTRYIVPDVVVRQQRGRWVASLNQEAVPRLRINRLYAGMLQKNRSGSAGQGLSGQLQEARWLIRNIRQRFDTIQRVSQAIVDRQQAFLDHGEVAMRPLTLREIAEILELHESTISRVTTQKYMATPRGIFELKYFFGSHVATEAGGVASSTAIRALIKQLVSEENGRKPLSDARMADLLGQQGIVVARRTVAKYRESLNIPPANLRKSL